MGGETLDFRAGSYSSYNRWRDQLAGLVNACVGVDNEHGPFDELINFSDCEGFIGPKTSAKLAKDFDDHVHKAKEETYNAYFFELYQEWSKAFHIAAGEGVVVFG